MHLKRPISSENKDVPKKFLDGLTGDIMENPMMVSINEELLIVDQSSIPSTYKGEKKPQLHLKAEIANWKSNISGKKYNIENADYYIKICVFGDPRVGKTSLINRYCKDTFVPNQPSTRYADFVLMHRALENGKTVAVTIWEAGHNDNFSNIGRSYLRNADAFIFVADATVKTSFDHIEDYLNDVKWEGVEVNGLILNKVDIEDQRVVPSRLATKLVTDHNMLFSITSAKANLNVQEVFDNVIEAALNKQLEKTQKEAPRIKLLRQIQQNYKSINNYLEDQLSRPKLESSQKKNDFQEKLNELSKNQYDWIGDRSIDELNQKSAALNAIISATKNIAEQHRENRATSPLSWFFKANWLRNTKSLNDFQKIFDEHNNARPEKSTKR